MSEHDRREARDQDKEREDRSERREERREDIRIEERKEDKIADKTLIECLTRIETKIDSALHKLIDFQNKILAAFVALIGAIIGEKFVGTPPVYTFVLILLMFSIIFTAIRVIFAKPRGFIWLTIGLTFSGLSALSRFLCNLELITEDCATDLLIMCVSIACVGFILYSLGLNSGSKHNVETRGSH